MAKDSYGKTCLHYAVIENNLPILKMLVNDCGNNINKNIVDNEFKSLVHYCVSVNNFGSYENEEMLNYLLDNKFLSTSQDIYNKTPLYYSLKQKSLKNVNILKNKKVLGADKIEPGLYHNYSDEINKINACSISEVDIEKDSKEYLDKKLKEVTYIEYDEQKNLNDKNFRLYKEDDEYWDVILIKVDGYYEIEFHFYIISLIYNIKKNIYCLKTDYGINEQSSEYDKFLEFDSLEQAKNKFKEIFEEKTGNLWQERNNFKKIEGKYTLYMRKKVKYKIKEFLESFDYDKYPNPVMIKDKAVLELFKNMVDISKIEYYLDLLIDTNKELFSYSTLTEKFVFEIKNCLLEIVKRFNEIENLNKIDISEEDITNESNENTDINEEIEKTDKKYEILKDKKIALGYEIMEFSKKYYELLPRNKGFIPFPFSSLHKARLSFQDIVFLTNLQKCIKILLAAYNKINDIHPFDYLYYTFQTILEPIYKETAEFKIIEKYINASYKKDKITDIIRVIRKEETKTREKFENLSNHYLLFHGTKITNLSGILLYGFNPPNTPFTHSAYVFGNGIYFTDVYNKSKRYSEIIKDENNLNIKYNYIILCEVALGNIKYKDNSVDLDKKEFLQQGYNSLKSFAYRGPDYSKNFVCYDGLIIPLGNIIEYNYTFLRKSENPEYVIFDKEQIKIRYIVKIENY